MELNKIQFGSHGKSRVSLRRAKQTHGSPVVPMNDSKVMCGVKRTNPSPINKTEKKTDQIISCNIFCLVAFLYLFFFSSFSESSSS